MSLAWIMQGIIEPVMLPLFNEPFVAAHVRKIYPPTEHMACDINWEKVIFGTHFAAFGIKHQRNIVHTSSSRHVLMQKWSRII